MGFPGDDQSGRLFLARGGVMLLAVLRDRLAVGEFRNFLTMAIKGLELAMACAKAADEVKAENIRIWDMRKVSGLTDYMIVCSASSMPQLRAILNEVSRRVEEEHGVKAIHREGKVDARWVVLDYIDVMVHVMQQELRDFYGLEELWKDAKEIPMA
jgi:ribosome-associated protein